ncbi:MAG: LamG domain-containing protein [Candidatus Neomarinimicrobiota bacterium]|nr:MAG: LamG domain-containing protein [Candidatus Neomarinimicrobiota bacterium]
MARYRTLPKLIIIFTILSIAILIKRREEYKQKWEELMSPLPAEVERADSSGPEQVAPQEVPLEPVLLDTGLVGWYSFYGNAKDGSTAKNHGQIHGAQPAPDRFGNAKNAYYFDGHSYIELPESPSLQSTRTGFSVTAWVNQESTLGRQGVVSWDGHWYLGIFNGALLGAVFRYPLEQREYQCRPWLQPGKWHFIALTYDTQYMRFYQDGKLIDQIQYPARRLGQKQYNIFHKPAIGHGVGSEQRAFKGWIDEVRIYNRPLNRREIETLYSLTE